MHICSAANKLWIPICCCLLCCCFFVYVFHEDADRDEIVFVRNATVGNNAIIKSVVSTLKPGDSILTLSVAYGKGTALSSIQCSTSSQHTSLSVYFVTMLMTSWYLVSKFFK